MNEAVLKFLASGVIGLVVVSALWLAGSVQATHKPSPYRMAQAQQSQATNLLMAALPAARAASATVGVR